MVKHLILFIILTAIEVPLGRRCLR